MGYVESFTLRLFTLGENSPQFPQNRGWVGPRFRLGPSVKRKKPFCPAGNQTSIPWSPASGIVTIRAEVSWILEGHEDYEQVTEDGLHPTEIRSTWDVQVLRSPNLLFIFKKTTHHTKLKKQSFLNVITL